MSTVPPFDGLEAYIMRLDEIKEQRRQKVTKDDLIAAAQMVGFSPSEIAELDEISANCLKRGHGYIKVGRWNDAQKELYEALALNHLSEKYLAEVANFHLSRYKALGKKEDAQRAESLAKLCLDIAPEADVPLELLREIDILRYRKNLKAKRRWIWFVSLSVLFGLLLFIIYKLNYTPVSGYESKRYPVDFELSKDAKLEGLVIDFRNTEIAHDDTNEGKSIDFMFDCRIASNEYELRHLGLEMHFFDETGTELAQTYYWPWSQEDMSMLPGDLFYFRNDQVWSSVWLEKPAKITKVLATVHAIEKFRGAAEYATDSILPSEWACTKPENINVELAMRYASLRVLQAEDQTTEQRLLLTATNTGAQDIRELSIVVTWFDENNNPLNDRIFKVIKIGEIPLKPKERVLFLFDESFYTPEWNFPEPFASYKVQIKTVS